MTTPHAVAGIVLCGGESSRMGRPKAWLPFAGEQLLPRVVRILREVVDPVVVVAAAGQDLPPLPSDVAVLRDEKAGQGPLGGLTTGLAALAGRATAAYVSGCDVPFLRPGFVRRMIDLLADHAICVPVNAGRPHPLAAVYRIDVLASARRMLEQGRLRLGLLLDECDTRSVAVEELREVDPELVSLENVNAPADYEAALRLEAGPHRPSI